jgi:rRNA maturation protein Nop10
MIHTCPYCGNKFQSRFFSGGPGNVYTFTNTTLTESCPRCGRSVQSMPSGSYTFDEDGVARLLASPEFTPAVLGQLKELAQKAQNDPELAQNFTAEANAILPSLGDQLEAFCDKRKYTIAFFVFIITAITGMYGMLKSEDPPSTTINYQNTYISVSSEKPIHLRPLDPSPSPRGTHLTPKKKKRKPRR